MKLNPFHHAFGFTKNASKKSHIPRMRLLKRHNAGNMIGIAHYENQHTHLHQLCQKHGTDKGNTDIQTHALSSLGVTHNYAAVYDLLFAQKRNSIHNFLECGIGTINPDLASTMATYESAVDGTYKPGASLRAWQEYFPNALITGIDIDQDCMITDERIETYQCDQTKPESIKQFLKQIGDRKFDIVIDDGLHKFHAGITLFENIIDRLENDGIYIIEDVNENKLEKFAEYFRNKNYFVRFFVLVKWQTYTASNLVMITNASR